MQVKERASNYLNPSDDQFKNIYILKELDEIRGPLTHFEVLPEGLLAIVAGVVTLFPVSLEAQIRAAVGRDVAILRCGGYRFRRLPR